MNSFEVKRTTTKEDKNTSILILVDKMISRSNEIFGNLNRESIDVYNFLMDEFHKGDARKNHLFQFVFRSFYRMDNAGLSPEFKTRFFELMEENRKCDSIDLRAILSQLYEIRTRRDIQSFQFSFTTKLINTIDPTQPIYDSKVSKAIFGSDYVINGDFDKKFQGYTKRYNLIKETYLYCLSNNSFTSIFESFDKAFPSNRLTNIKKLDFLFWSYGKLLDKE